MLFSVNNMLFAVTYRYIASIYLSFVSDNRWKITGNTSLLVAALSFFIEALSFTNHDKDKDTDALS